MSKSASESLTSRQQQVYDLLCGGSSRQEIAQKLGVSLNTIKKRAKAGLLKLDAQTASQAAATFYRPEAPAPREARPETPPPSKEPGRKQATSPGSARKEAAT